MWRGGGEGGNKWGKALALFLSFGVTILYRTYTAHSVKSKCCVKSDHGNCLKCGIMDFCRCD